MMNLQRYRVSLWSHQSFSVEDGPLYLRQETVSSTGSGALSTVMRQANITTIYRAKVVALSTGVCQWLDQVSVEQKDEEKG